MDKYVCDHCGIGFSSKLRFESHLRANSQEAFINTFEKIANLEIAAGRFPTGAAMITERILPRKNELIEERRRQGGFKNDKTKQPMNPAHINVKEGNS